MWACNLFHFHMWIDLNYLSLVQGPLERRLNGPLVLNRLRHLQLQPFKLPSAMDYDGQAAMQLMNLAQVKGTGNSNSNIRNTPFTVDEALPYSPFSSIVPFDSGTWLSKYLLSHRGNLAKRHNIANFNFRNNSSSNYRHSHFNFNLFHHCWTRCCTTRTRSSEYSDC